MVNKIATKERLRPIRFNLDADIVNVPMQSEVYGMHPRNFVFDKFGNKLQLGHDDKEDHRRNSTEADTDSVSPNARRKIIEQTLRNGAAWEVPTIELISKLTKASKKKFVKARLGTKAAKNYERLENAGDELEGEAATMFRALAARYLYLSMDRPECACSAKELCPPFACPTKKGVETLKRAVRFRVGKPRLVCNCPFQALVSNLQVYVDTEFAG